MVSLLICCMCESLHSEEGTFHMNYEWQSISSAFVVVYQVLVGNSGWDFP